METPTQIKVFVSCPGDVKKEKDLVKKAAEILSSSYADSDLSFIIYDWLDLNRKFGPRPQEIINSIYTDYDIYIGILWNRFGTPSGAFDPDSGIDFRSGTEEEFSLSVKRWKGGEKLEIYFYFKEMSRPSLLNRAQQNLVMDFQEKIEQEYKSWFDTFPETDESLVFYQKVNKVLNDVAIGKIKKAKKVAKTAAIKLITHIRPSAPNVSFLSSGTLPVSHPVQRRLSPYSDWQKSKISIDSPKTFLLKELIDKHRLIAVLGNPGSGKSAELSLLAENCKLSDSLYIPVFKRLNTYINEDINDFLPHGWDAYPEGALLVILDGLDEVQPQHFNSVVRKIQSFVERYEQIHVVLSCRTNFYQLPTTTSSGTLPGFDAFVIDPLDRVQQQNFAAWYLKNTGKAFMAAVKTQRLSELAAQPFFLRTMLEVYKSQGTLSGGKGQLFERLLNDRFSIDLEHYKTTIGLRHHKRRVLKMLEKIAMVMEYQGRNYIADDDLQKVIAAPEDLNLLRFSTCFNTHSQRGVTVWSFEHNNLQEYLAARALHKMPFTKIKAFLAFEGKKLKPSWANTLFFLISIADKRLSASLINWLKKEEQEILVRMEPEKLDIDLRLQIFTDIFNRYKKENIWLRSNKFSSDELARFGSSTQAFTFLLAELASATSSRYVRFNALQLLEYFNLTTAQRQKIKQPLIDLIESNQNDHYLIYSLMTALAKFRLAGVAEIDFLMGILGQRENQYIRAGFYALIDSADQADHYLNYLLTGIGLTDKESEDRSEVALMDESLRLRLALEQINSVNGIIKMLRYFRNALDRDLLRYFDRDDVVVSMVNQAIELYKNHPDMFKEVMTTYREYGRSSQEKDIKSFAGFFTETGTRLNAVGALLADQELQDYQRAMLIAPMLDQTVVDKLIADYHRHDINNEQLGKLYFQLGWAAVGLSSPEAMAYFKDRLRSETEIDLMENKGEEYRRVKKERAKYSFELLFQPKEMLDQIATVFSEEQWVDLNWEDLWATRKRGGVEFEENLPESIFNLLADFTRQDRSVTLDELQQWAANGQVFLDYRMSKIADVLKGKPGIELSDEQIQQVQQWVTERAKFHSITKGIKVDESNTQFSIVENVQLIWYFVTNLNLELSSEKLLDFTESDEMRSGFDGLGLDFEFIEKRLGEKELSARVLKNLENGIEYDGAWKNNALYAIEKGIYRANAFILRDLLNERKSIYIRKSVLKTYYELTGDYEGVYGLLPFASGELKWKIIELIKNQSTVAEDLSEFLLTLLNGEVPGIVEKLQAARYLTELNVIEGFYFYANYLLECHNPAYDYHFNSAFLRTLTNPLAIPKLISLLEMAKEPEFLNDDFNRLDTVVTDALFNIGLANEFQLKLIVEALDTFIKTHQHIEHINFMRTTIDQMEYRFYLNKSQTFSLEEAISEIEQISWEV